MERRSQFGVYGVVVAILGGVCLVIMTPIMILFINANLADASLETRFLASLIPAATFIALIIGIFQYVRNEVFVSSPYNQQPPGGF